MSNRLDTNDRIPHRVKDCLRVQARITCDECGYPASEAQYSDETEFFASLHLDTRLIENVDVRETKSLFDKDSRYTDVGLGLDSIIKHKLLRTFNQYLSYGYSPREIHYVMDMAIMDISLNAVLDITSPLEKLMAEKMEKKESDEDGISGMDVPPTRGGTGKG